MKILPLDDNKLVNVSCEELLVDRDSEVVESVNYINKIEFNKLIKFNLSIFLFNLIFFKI